MTTDEEAQVEKLNAFVPLANFLSAHFNQIHDKLDEIENKIDSNEARLKATSELLSEIFLSLTHIKNEVRRIDKLTSPMDTQ